MKGRRATQAVAAAVAFLALASAAGAAGFDCAKARTEDDRAICADPELSRLDDEMTAAYRKLWDTRIRYEVAAVQSAFRANQKEWLGQRARCGATTNCLRDSYRARNAWLAHPLQAYTGRYENARLRLYLTLDRDLVPTLRLFLGATGEDLVLMEKSARFVPADKADGEDRVAASVQFAGAHRKLGDTCRELHLDFGIQDKPSLAFNDGCAFIPKPPDTIVLKQRSFNFSAPVR